MPKQPVHGEYTSIDAREWIANRSFPELYYYELRVSNGTSYYEIYERDYIELKFRLDISDFDRLDKSNIITLHNELTTLYIKQTDLLSYIRANTE